MDAQSLSISASFLARLHPLIFRSTAIASVMRSKCPTKRAVQDGEPRCNRGCAPTSCSVMRFVRLSLAGCAADVKRAVRTSQHVDKGALWDFAGPIILRRLASLAPQDDGSGS